MGPHFIRQSVQSDYCGVYSAGMFLSKLGYRTSREEALRLFDLPRRDRACGGVELGEIAAVLKRAGNLASVRWRFSKQFEFRNIVRTVQHQSTSTGHPTLLWFGIVHRNLMTQAHHVAVVIHAERETLKLLDPLGLPPRPKSPFNVVITSTPGLSGFLPALGSFYYINPRMAAGVLCWSYGT